MDAKHLSDTGCWIISAERLVREGKAEARSTEAATAVPEVNVEDEQNEQGGQENLELSHGLSHDVGVLEKLTFPSCRSCTLSRWQTFDDDNTCSYLYSRGLA